MPNLLVVRIENVRALKRIRVTNEPTTLRILAQIHNDKTVDVEIQAADSSLMSCRVAFAKERPSPPQPSIKPALDSKASSLPVLYGPKAMFHGPRLQSVLQLDEVWANGIAGVINAGRAYDWFASYQSPLSASAFLIDPLLLDNTTQFTLFYLFERQENVLTLLPFHTEAIEFFGERQVSGPAKTRVHFSSVTAQGTACTIEVLNQEEQVAIRLSGLSSKRIVVPPLWSDFIQNPAKVFLSRLVAEKLEVLPEPDNWVLTQFNDDSLPDDSGTVEWLSDYVLSSAEQEYFSAKSKVQKRKREWLSGRIAAKEAVRTLIKQYCHLDLCPADIEISADEHGRPVLAGSWVDQIGFVPQLSIAHADGTALALAGLPHTDLHPGIDIEPVRNRGQDFESMAFTKSEQEMFAKIAEPERDIATTLVWCAKEALAKALTFGQEIRPQDFEVKSIDAGQMLVLAQSQAVYIVNSYCEDEVVTAITVGRRFAGMPPFDQSYKPTSQNAT